ncbi:hypothetical protein NHJ13051_009291 [Beauveria bassiana]
MPPKLVVEQAATLTRPRIARKGNHHVGRAKTTVTIVFCYSTILETASRFPRKAALRSVLHDTIDDGAIKGQVGSSDHGLSDSASPNLPSCPTHDPIDDSAQQHCLQIHSLVYKLAEVYAVDELKVLALAKFKQALSAAVDAADFAAAAGEAYADMIESLGHLRQAVIKGLHHHRKVILQTEEVKTLLHSNGIIGYDLALYFTQNNPFL